MILDLFFNKDINVSKRKSNTDKISRSIAKTISWRLLGTLDTVLISWLITGKITMALSIGSIELVSKMLLYFFHERIWNNIKWGKNASKFKEN